MTDARIIPGMPAADDRAAWLEARRAYIGGSDANIIMSGDAERIHRLWEIKIGARDDDDLSDVLPVQMGLWTEPLNRRWFTMQTGIEITRAGEFLAATDHPFMGCTLDGMADGDVFEAKHVNAFSKYEDVRARYMPQLHHMMAVTGAPAAWLSVFVGTLKYEHERIECDLAYLSVLIDAESRFWRSVQTRTPPGDAPVIAAPVKPERVADMSGNNAWASSAADWLATAKAAKTNAAAAKTLREAVEPDVMRATGHGVEISRSKSGSLLLREAKS